MTYRGHVEGGMIVLEGKKRPPAGAAVKVVLIAASTHRKSAASPTRKVSGPAGKASNLSAVLLRHAGKGRKLPRDLARNHDHYLHGTPKK